MDPQVVLDRLVRLAKLDFTVFDEVKADPQQTLPAVGIAVVSFLLFGLGGFLLFVFKDVAFVSKGAVFTKSVLLGGIFSIALFFVWAFIAYALLTSVFKASGDIQMLVRTMGYASVGVVPGLLFCLPAVGFAFGLLGLVLLVLFVNAAIQSTTNAAPDKVIIANIAGFLLFSLVLSLLVGDASSENYYAPNIFLSWIAFK